MKIINVIAFILKLLVVVSSKQFISLEEKNYFNNTDLHPINIHSYSKSFNENENQEKKLASVFITFRHGTRAPYTTNGKDCFGTQWENIAELLPGGKKILYLSGLAFREKYKDIITDNISREVNIKSTNVNRTIESVYSFVQGFTEGAKNTLNENQLKNAYPPGYENLSENVKNKIKLLNDNPLPYEMTIIPIVVLQSFNEYNPASNVNCEDYILNVYPEKVNTDKSIKIAKNLYLKHEDTFKNKLKIDFEENYSFFKRVSKVVDAFLSNHFNGIDLSNYFENIEETVQDMLIFNRDHVLILTGGENDNFIMSKVYSTSYFRELLEKFKSRKYLLEAVEKPGYNADNPKFQIFSGHDITVAAQLNFLSKTFGLNLDFVKNTIFGSHLVFELKYLKNKDTLQFSVEAYYNSVLILDREYNEFVEKISILLISDEEKNNFCNLKDIRLIISKVNHNLKIAFIVLSSISAIILIAISYFLLFGKKKLVPEKFQESESIL